MRFRRFSEAEKLCGNNYFSKTVCVYFILPNINISRDENRIGKLS